MKSSVATKYARATVTAAARANRAEKAAEDIAALAEFFASEDGVKAGIMLQSGSVDAEVRRSLAHDIASTIDLSPEVGVLFAALIDSRELRGLPAISTRARGLAESMSPVARVEIRTARPLNDATVSRIAEAMRGVLGREVRTVVVEDESVIAGVMVRAGNRIWDGTLAGRLERTGPGAFAEAGLEIGMAED